MRKSVPFCILLFVNFLTNASNVQVRPTALSDVKSRIQGVLLEPLVLDGDTIMESRPSIYLLDAATGNVLDSTVLSSGTHGSFQFGVADGSPSWKKLWFKWRNPRAGYGEYISSALIPVEAGALSVSFNVNQYGSERLKVSGTHLAKKYTTYLTLCAQTSPAKLHEVMETQYSANKENVMGILYLGFLLDNKAIKTSVQAETYLKDAGEVVRSSPLIALKLDRLRKAEATNVGKPYTNVTGMNPLTGVTSSLSDFVGKGRVVVLDFWGSWCVPCRKAMPMLKEIHARYGNRVTFVGIAINDTQSDCSKAIKDLGIGWDVIQFKDGEAAKIYDVSFVPTLVILSKEGTIVEKAIPLEALEERLKKMLEL